MDDQVCLHMTVADTGIGITPDQLKHLFEPFSQANGATTRLYGGTGLGLAICKSLVELMKGKIWVESKPGHGSVFHFTLWIKKEAVTAQGEATTPAVPELPEQKPDRANAAADQCNALSETKHAPYAGKTILLVEDNEINQEIGLELLRLNGIHADVATHGIAAIEAVCAKNYDLIFMDIQMPVMDGLEATRNIRSSGLPWAATVPIVAMTANAMRSDREKSLEAGMNDHITKPIDIDHLQAVLQHWLGSERPNSH